MSAPERRLEEIMEVILAMAGDDFERRAWVGSGEDVLDGIAAGLNMLCEEVGRRRRMEESFRARAVRSERLAAVGGMAAGVAHEINNPAAVLLMNFAALAERVRSLGAALATAPPEVAALLSDVAEIARVGDEQTARIVEVVRGLRRFSQVETDSVTEVRLDQVAEEACALVAHELTHRARLVKHLSPMPPVAGAHARLVQVVTALLLNAVQAVDDAGPSHAEIELVTRVENDHLLLSVRDSGRGIPEEHRDHVFELFFTTRREPGAGLGLSVAADIAHQHGGEVRLVSSTEGTTATLVLPRVTPLGPRPSAAPASVSAARRRVLMIDDEPAMLRAYQRLIGKKYDVVTVEGGAAAIATLEQDRSWDSIVCDMLMPEVDGVAVWEWIEANAPPLLPRLWLCTGGAFSGRARAFVEQNPTRVLEKPLARATLEAAIEAAAQRGQ